MFHVKHGLKKVTVSKDALKEARGIYNENNDSLEKYLDQLLSWNKKINLVSRTVSRETVREHVVHSLLPLALKLTRKHPEWIDSGSGGGLPGVPLAICCPDQLWLLNDNVKKKMWAVTKITEALKLENTRILAKSISLVDIQKGTGILTKHAFKVEDLLRLLGNKPWKTIIMWKGVEGVIEELETSKKKLNCTVYQFEFGSDEEFYEGKGLLKIER